MSIAGSKKYTNAFEVLESVLAAQAVHIKDLLAFSSLTNCAVRIFIIFKFALHILRFQICLTLQIALLAHNAN